MTVSSFGSPGSYVNGSAYSAGRDVPRDSGLNLGSRLGGNLGDDSLDKIRDLLFGELRRTWEARLHTLETRLQTLEDKLDAVRHETKSTQQGQLATLAEGIDQLGQHVRRLTRT